MEASAGVTRIARLAAVDALTQSLGDENKAVADDIAIHQSELWGDAAATAGGSGGEDEMRIMAGGDVYLGQPPSAAEPEKPIVEPGVPAPPAPTVPAKQSSSLLDKALAAGLVIAGTGVGVGAPLVAYNLTRPDANAEDSDTRYSLGIFREAGASTDAE